MATANERLKVTQLGTIFQIYPNGLPDQGECLRFKGHYITKEKNLKDSISDIIANSVRGLDSDNNKYEDNSERHKKSLKWLKIFSKTKRIILK